MGDIGFATSGVGFPDVEQGGAEGIPFFKVSDMNTPENSCELIVANNYVSNDQIARNGWHPISTVPAIFFAKVGAAVYLNRKRLVNRPFLLDNNTMAFSLDARTVTPPFAKFLFEGIDLAGLTQVGALPSLSASDVEGIGIALPAQMSEQRRIGDLFSHFDNLITLHQREPPF